MASTDDFVQAPESNDDERIARSTQRLRESTTACIADAQRSAEKTRDLARRFSPPQGMPAVRLPSNPSMPAVVPGAGHR